MNPSLPDLNSSTFCYVSIHMQMHSTHQSQHLHVDSDNDLQHVASKLPSKSVWLVGGARVRTPQVPLLIEAWVRKVDCSEIKEA